MTQKSRFDIQAASWDTPYRIERSGEIAALIREKFLFDKEMEMLDYGSGSGLMAFRFAEDVKSVDSADNSTGMLEVIADKKKKLGIENVYPVTFDIEKEVLDKKYDVIFTQMTLHHLKDMENTAAKFSQMTKKNGYNILVDLDKEEGDFHHDLTGIHHFGFEKDKLIEIFTGIGFEAERSENFYTLK